MYMKYSRRFNETKLKLNNRTRSKRTRSKSYNKRNKIIQGGGIEWNGFHLISNYDDEYIPAKMLNKLKSYNRRNTKCIFIENLVNDLNEPEPSANMIFFRPNKDTGYQYISGFVQYTTDEVKLEIQITNLCCWFKSLVELKLETNLEGNYSAGQIMMAMTISYLSKKYKNYTIWLSPYNNGKVIKYYKNCGFSFKGDPKKEWIMRYKIPNDEVDIKSVIEKFTPNLTDEKI